MDQPPRTRGDGFQQKKSVMNRLIVIALGTAAAAGLAAGCGSSGTTATSASSGSAAPASPSGGAATLKAQSSTLGKILVDGAGRTLYLFKADTGTTSNCNGACAQAWPPDVTPGQPSAIGLPASMVGVTMRADHRTEVTYNGHPLYYFIEDSKPGDTKGEGVNAFGGLWYVVSPSGDAITSGTGASSSSAPAQSGGGGGGY